MHGDLCSGDRTVWLCCNFSAGFSLQEFEREKHAHSVLQFQFAEVKEALRQREEMLEVGGGFLSLCGVGAFCWS